MSFKPYTGDFYVLEGIRHDMSSIPIAIGTDKQEMAMFAISICEKYSDAFVAFGVVFVGSTLEAIDALNAQQTHSAPTTRN